jgi:hypothetical protein
MKLLNLREFAERLRRIGTSQESDFADEILELVDLGEEIAGPYGTLCDDLEHYAPDHKGGPSHKLEWLGDRSNLLGEIESELERARTLQDPVSGDADDTVKELLGRLEEAEAILTANGWTEGDFLDALQALADRPPTKEYDL